MIKLSFVAVAIDRVDPVKVMQAAALNNVNVDAVLTTHHHAYGVETIHWVLGITLAAIWRCKKGFLRFDSTVATLVSPHRTIH